MEFNAELIAHIAGAIGTVIVVIAYLLLQTGKMKGDDWAFLNFNLVGALLLLYSLFWFPNIGSIIIEIFWIGITLYGMVKKLRKG